MTNEEIVEEYLDKRYLKDMGIRVPVKEALLYGLAEGKPKWHNLRKNPNDLPKEDCTEVMFVTENKNETLTGKYKNGGGEGTPIFDTFGIAFYGVEQVIALCELPKFKE